MLYAATTYLFIIEMDKTAILK